ncbi:MAG: hypothetical protein M3285_09495 [Actinomycetota bacterium]|nr:hypothetical protein [Actinomycetota bacterium]
MGELILAQGEPAGGAGLTEILISSAGAVLMVIALAVAGHAHRSGQTKVLTRLGDFSSRVSGLPPWAALPSAVTAGSLLIAVFGFYWDVASHIDSGRDPGPFANPSHYLIIGGLLGIALAGYLSILLGTPDDQPGAVEIRPGWKVPAGGLLLLVCGMIAVLGFPLDDVWHRLFGQDVTLWSPTHIQMVGGAALSTLALCVLLAEGRETSRADSRSDWLMRISGPATAGAFLLGLSAFQAEFDYSVPQFRLLFHPIILMLSAGAALVAARVRLGKGGALAAVLFFLLIRGILSLVVGPLIGHTTLHFPLYIVEALAVEAVALVVGTDRTVRFALLSGAAIGTFGLGAEWLWSHVWMTIPWPASLAPEGIVMGVVAAVVGSLLGAYIGRALVAPRTSVSFKPQWIGVVAVIGVIACLAYPLASDASLDAKATVSLQDVEGRPGWVNADIAMEPEDAAEGAQWFTITSWQGGGSVVEELEATRPGRYKSPAPIPVHGEWKALLRLHKDTSLMALPVYLPADPVIGEPEVPARSEFTRPFISDKKIVLREAKEVDGPIIYGASSAIGLIALIWVLVLGWGLVRLQNWPARRSESLSSAA